MRICLIIPPSVFLLDERVFMTLGILRVASVLEQNQIPVDVLDLSGITNYEDVVADYCLSKPTRVFGITSTTPQLPAATSIKEKIRQILPDAKVILGGPHVTLVNSAAKNILGQRRGQKILDRLINSFDVLVAGDGERAIFEAIRSNTRGLIDADSPDSPLFIQRGGMDSLPFPARHLVEVPSYHYFIDGIRALSIIAQLGCPFECGFCGGRNSPTFRRIRTRSSENIIAEMRQIFEHYGISGFMFYDDELNVNKEMTSLMEKISALQQELKTEFRLRGFIKAELFNDQQAKAMFQAGFRWILVGFESGSPIILSNINKKATRKENSSCLEIARRNGLKVKALMSIGHPGESSETITQTTDWLIENRPDDFDVSIITTYPGTPYFDEAIYCGRRGVWVYTCPKSKDTLYAEDIDFSQVADYYKGKPGGGYVSYVSTEYLTADELVTERDKLESKVRAELNIPFNPGATARRYEHSMGQGGLFLPSYMLKSTD